MTSSGHSPNGCAPLDGLAEGSENQRRIIDEHDRLLPPIDVITDFDTSLPELPCYPAELNQVWTNIVDNAIAAMRQGHDAHASGIGTQTVRTLGHLRMTSRPGDTTFIVALPLQRKSYETTPADDIQGSP